MNTPCRDHVTVIYGGNDIRINFTAGMTIGDVLRKILDHVHAPGYQYEEWCLFSNEGAELDNSQQACCEIPVLTVLRPRVLH